jgi:hypothetical protein
VGNFGAPPVNHSNRPIVPLDGKGHVDHAVDLFDLLENPLGMLGVGSGLFEVAVDLVKKAEIVGHGAPLSESNSNR